MIACNELTVVVSELDATLDSSHKQKGLDDATGVSALAKIGRPTASIGH